MHTSRRTATFSLLTALLATVAHGGDTRTIRSRKEQSCESPMAARKLNYDQHYFLIPPPPSDFDPSTWLVFPWCRGAAVRGNEPVRGVKFNIRNGFFFSEDDETVEIPFPDTRVKTKADGTVTRALAGQDDELFEMIVDAFDMLHESRRRSAFYFTMDPLGGRRADGLVTECGVTFSAPCQADADTWCMDHGGVVDRFQIDFSALNNGNFVLEANLDGGTLTFPNNRTMWDIRMVTGPGIPIQIVPGNQQALDLFLQPEVFDLFNDGIRITDRATGDSITGPNTRDPDWSPLDDPGEGHLDFQQPRVFRMGVKLSFD